MLKLIWMLRAAWLQTFGIAIAYISVAFLMAYILVGCGSVGTITRFSDGTISETHAITFGSTAAVTDFKDRLSTSGRTISFGAGQTDVNVEALRQSNDILEKLVEGLSSGAIKGLK